VERGRARRWIVRHASDAWESGMKSFMHSGSGGQRAIRGLAWGVAAGTRLRLPPVGYRVGLTAATGSGA